MVGSKWRSQAAVSSGRPAKPHKWRSKYPVNILYLHHYYYVIIIIIIVVTSKKKKRTPFVQVDTSQICAFPKKSSICALIFILTLIRMGQWTSATDSDIGKWRWQEEKEEIIMETNRQKEDNNRCVCVWRQWHYYYYYYYYYEYYLKTKVKEPWLLALSFSETVLWCSLFRTLLCTCMYTFMSTIHPFSEPYHSCRGSEAYISWLWTSVNWNNSINQKEMWVFFHQSA